MKKITLGTIILIMALFVFNVGFCKVTLLEKETLATGSDSVENTLLPADRPLHKPSRSVGETSPLRHYTETPAGKVHSDYGLHYVTI